MIFRTKLWHRHKTRWLRFPISERYFGDRITFSVVIFIIQSQNPLYFYFRFTWSNDPENGVTVAHPHRDYFHQIWSWYDHSFRSYDVCTTHCDLHLCPFDLERSQYIARHVIKPHTNFERPRSIRSWVMIDWTSYHQYFQHELWLHCAYAVSRHL